jgi:MYXO-CTERM domain-containing protein
MKQVTFKNSLVISFVSLSLFVTAANAGAQTALSLGGAVKTVLHRSAAAHDSQFFNTPLNGVHMMEILPEPNFGALIALGGLVLLAAWRLRRRSIQKLRPAHSK